MIVLFIFLREIPTIIHSLNLVPTQGEMHDLLTEVCNKKKHEKSIL